MASGIVRFALAILIAAVGCSTAPGTLEPEPFRVMTYNIRLDLASDGANAWPHRKEAVAEIIRASGADLVGLQEALPGQLADLDGMLPSFARFGEGRDADRSGEHCAVYYRSERFELLDHGTFWLSPTPEVAGSRGWDAAYPRIVTWGRLLDLRTGGTFHHFNTHFDHVGEEARREGAALLVSRIREIAGEWGAVIVTGDFNSTSDSEPWRIIRSAGLRDTYEVTVEPHSGPHSTWNGFDEIVPGRRIDAILAGGDFDVLRHAIVPDRLGDNFPSDHLPVWSAVRSTAL